MMESQLLSSFYTKDVRIESVIEVQAEDVPNLVQFLLL